MGAIFIAMGAIALVVVTLLAGGLVWGIGRAAGWGNGGKRRLEAAKKPQPYAYLNAENKVSKEQMLKIAQGYTDDGALGIRAQDVLETFGRSELLRKDILSLLKREFEEGSLTWDKFSIPVESACDGILSNSVQIVNRMQAFDSAEYQRLDRIDRAGGLEGRQTEQHRLAVMRTALEEMDNIQQANDRLLLELEKLQAELNKLSGDDAESETDAIAAEIRELVDDTHYYA
ncbi:MAG: hypothetical protein Q4A01_03575 [Coriobacteriales bacterium]|nr:hypothetical protein [Coriobacteriales bacterium]